ncbi:MAG: hypothetical protein GX227_11085 [Clostridiaceae bacterium]|jgi:hypothetical protein|nr:hypothetical protein [Clostridiaceae bacterium]
MKTEKKERIKTRVLVLLVALSIIQIGIHWNNQTQGLPFNFISSIFSGNGKTLSLDVETLKEKYFKPEAVIVSIGTNHWRLDERDTQYHRVWKDIRDNYLSVMIRQKAEKILPKEEWLKIIRSRCVRIDFLVNWPGGIVHWFGNTKPGDSKSFEGIQSIVIVPDDNVNQTINTVYVYDEKQVYQYQVDLKNEFLPKSYYSKLADELTNKNKPRQSLLSSYPNFVSEKDIFVPKPGDQGYDHSLIEVSIPEPVVLNMANIENYSIQDSILLQQKVSLSAQYTETSDNALFTDTENLYRLFKDGVLEYKYIPANTAQAGDVSEAFNHALSFIEHRRSLVGETDIVLTRIVPERRYYLLEFSYKLNGVFVYYSDNEEKGISAPIVMKVNSERILECRWVLRNFKNIGKNSYSESFGELLNNQIATSYPEIIDREIKSFTRLEQGYIFRSTDDSGTLLAPNWIISTDVRDYFIPLLGKKG